MGHVVEYMGDVLTADISREDVTRLIASLLRRGWKPTSVSAVHRPMRTFCRWAVRRGYMSTDPTAYIRLTVPVPDLAIPTVDDIRRVLQACHVQSRHGFRARRDAAILRIMATTGLRLAEVAGVQLSDLETHEDGQLSVRVLGKGRKERTVPLDPPTTASLLAYLSRERPRSPFAGRTSIWLASKGPMTASGIAQMVSDRGRAAGVALHPHALRHYALGAMLRAGMSEGDTMAISGHSTRAMLDRYTAHDRAERASAAFLAAPRVAL